MPLSRKDLDGFMENWEDQTRTLLLRRIEDRFRKNILEQFSPDEGVLLRAIVDRLIPQRREDYLDLVGFIDSALGKPLGRGDRQEGVPAEEELFHRGLRGTEETARAMFGRGFAELSEGQQDTVLIALQDGSAPGGTWRETPPQQFFIKLLMKALTGYCAHPFAWMRMGFPGPSYPEGYVWITEPEIQARRRHFPGWKTL